MGTLSFHADPALEKRIRLAAKERQQPLSLFLKESVEHALDNPDRKGRDLRGIVAGRSRLKPFHKSLPPWDESDLLLQ